MYEFDVFLSYRRTKQWPDFVKNLFLPRFDHWLSAELGEDPRIYFDVDDLETGVAWPQRLANGVASSKVMVCLWSRGYFASDWCKAELSHMLARRKAISPPHELLPLVLAVVIQDGIDVPSELVDIQQFPFHDCADPWIGEGGRKAELLSGRIRKLAGHVHMAMNQAPLHDPTWRDLAVGEFMRLFKRKL